MHAGRWLLRLYWIRQGDRGPLNPGVRTGPGRSARVRSQAQAEDLGVLLVATFKQPQLVAQEVRGVPGERQGPGNQRRDG